MQGTYRKYLLLVLMVILALNYVDRLTLGIVLQDIKREFVLTDTQLGFLSGIAFALFYSVMGLPIARWADRGNRVTIIAVTALVWSAAVALCGAATTFVQLMAIRVGVAIGEAGCVPPANSLISDYFSREERPRAIGIYTMGAPLAVVIGYFVSGWLDQFYGWRTTFVIIGIPGLVAALVAKFSLVEPRVARRNEVGWVSSSAVETVSPGTSTRIVMVTLWKNRTFRNMAFCWSLSNFFIYGVLQWQPAFFIRSYGVQTGDLGTGFGIAYGVFGLLGNYLGGVLASRYAANNERLQLRAMAALYLGFGVFSAFVYVVSNRYVALALLAMAALCVTATNGPFLATVQTLVPPQMRAMAVALLYLFANLIGLGLGPLAVGSLSDALHPLLGEESLRYALLTMCPGFVLCVWYALRASSTVVEDLRGVQEELLGGVSNEGVRGQCPS